MRYVNHRYLTFRFINCTISNFAIYKSHDTLLCDLYIARWLTSQLINRKMADFAIYKSQYVSDLAIYTSQARENALLSQDVGLCNL